MTTTTIPADLTGLDFEPDEPDLACQHSQHTARHRRQDPASLLVRSRCPQCGGGRTYLLCLSGWRLFGLVGVQCAHCGAKGTPREDMVIVLRVIRTRP